MSVSADIKAHLNTTKTLTGPFVDPNDATVHINGLDKTFTRDGTTAVPVDEVVTQQLALTAGAATINLASLPDLAGIAGAVVGTGKKVQAILFENPSTNANNMTISEGASNGYALLGASFTFVLAPAQWALFYLADVSPDVASGDRTIDVAGTGTQTLYYHLLLG